MSKKDYKNFLHFMYKEHFWALLAQLAITITMILGVIFNYFTGGWIVLVALVLWYIGGGILRVWDIYKDLE